LGVSSHLNQAASIVIIRNKCESLLGLVVWSNWNRRLLATVNVRCTSLTLDVLDDFLIADRDSVPALYVLFGIGFDGSIITGLDAQIEKVSAELDVDLLGLHDQTILLSNLILENFILHGERIEQINLFR